MHPLPAKAGMPAKAGLTPSQMHQPQQGLVKEGFLHGVFPILV
jgi:hypothetical protein